MSSQAYITRNRAPRVHITYEVYTGDAMKKVELPFIAMVWSDLSGKSAEELPGRDRPANPSTSTPTISTRCSSRRNRA